MKSINKQAASFIYSEPLYKIGGKVNKEEPKDIAFHGTNLKNITILIDDGDRVYKGLEFSLLKKILTAIGLTENDVAIVDVRKENPSWQLIQDQLEAKMIIAFGEDFKPTSFEKNHLKDINGVRVLVTDTLEALQENDLLKVPLWAELKKLKSS